MGDALRITHNQGRFLLTGASGNKMVAKVGTREFTDSAQAKINERLRLLGKALKKVSTKKDGNYIFGDIKNWKPIELKQSTMSNGGPISLEMTEVQKVIDWQLIDGDLEIDLPDANLMVRSGIYWLCYLWSHPGSATCQAAGFLDEVVWPLIEKLGKVDDFRKDIGLADDVDGDLIDAATKPAEKKAEAAPAA